MCRFLNHSLFVSFTLLFLTCCSSPNSDITYFPLDDGYKWRYSVSMITRDGLEKQQYILKNLGKSDLHNTPVHLKQSMDGTFIYYAVEEGVVMFKGTKSFLVPGGLFQPEQQVIMPNPVKLDDKWQTISTTRLLKKTGPPQKTEFKILANVPMDVSVESINETVNVPAGVFTNCVKIKSEGSIMKDAGNYVGLTLIDVEETSWYAPNVGLVKLERVETTKSEALDKGSLLIELADFKRG